MGTDTAHLCFWRLQDKLQALIDRAAFMPSFLTGASIEVHVRKQLQRMGHAKAAATAHMCALEAHT